MSQIQISSEDVFAYASQLKAKQQEVMAIFQDVKSKMDAISATWQSPASQSLMEQFRLLYPIFDAYLQALDQYSIFLNQTANAYQENEQILKAGVTL